MPSKSINVRDTIPALREHASSLVQIGQNYQLLLGNVDEYAHRIARERRGAAQRELRQIVTAGYAEQIHDRYLDLQDWYGLKNLQMRSGALAQAMMGREAVVNYDRFTNPMREYCETLSADEHAALVRGYVLVDNVFFPDKTAPYIYKLFRSCFWWYTIGRFNIYRYHEVLHGDNGYQLADWILKFSSCPVAPFGYSPVWDADVKTMRLRQETEKLRYGRLERQYDLEIKKKRLERKKIKLRALIERSDKQYLRSIERHQRLTELDMMSRSDRLRTIALDREKTLDYYPDAYANVIEPDDLTQLTSNELLALMQVCRGRLNRPWRRFRDLVKDEILCRSGE